MLAALLAPDQANPYPTRTVAVVQSADIPEYELAAKTITERLQVPSQNLVVMKVEDGGNSENARFWVDLENRKPDVVLTIGTQATQGALKYCSNIPVIFTMVLNQPDHSPSNRDYGGVTLNIPTDSQFNLLKKALPKTRRVGFIYSQASDTAYQQARKSAESMGLRLVMEKVESERDVPDSIRRMLPEIDALWMPPDRMMYENIVFRFVVLECFKNGVPIVSVYRRVAEAGIPIAVGVDYEDIANQTADLLFRRLSGGKFSRPVIEQPRKLVLYINEGVVSSLNIKIPDDLLSLTVPVKSGS